MTPTPHETLKDKIKHKGEVVHGVKQTFPGDPCSRLGKDGATSVASRPADGARFWTTRGLSVDVGSVPLEETLTIAP